MNARAESLLERVMFRDAVASGRCLIPADGYFEWQAVPGQRRKQPRFIRLRGADLLAFAGLSAKRAGRAGASMTCAVITTAANDFVAKIHHRMPAILLTDDEAMWLSPTVSDPVRLLECLRPYPAERMEAFSVSHLVSYPQR